MSSTFFGIQVASRGLQAQQAAIDVVGHNIANATSPDYHRQDAVIQAGEPYPFQPGVGPLGSGADVTEVRRLQDAFADARMLETNSQIGSGKARKETLDGVVSLIGEPSAQGLNHDLGQFWNAWQTVSQNPQDGSARNSVVGAGGAVAAEMNRLSHGLQDAAARQGQTIRADVDQINQIAGQLAQINADMGQIEGQHLTPNDLLDRRQTLLGKLSSLADVRVQGQGGPSDVITLGGRVLVQGDRASALQSGADSNGRATVEWASDSSPAGVSGGDLGGALQLQGTLIPGYLKQLDDVATTLMDRVNTLHSAAYGLDGKNGRAFFTGAGAADLQVNPALAADPSQVAASAGGAAGDGTTALSIAQLAQASTGGAPSVGDRFGALVSTTASDAAEAAQHVETQTQLSQQVSTQQQSVSGVSLDEEMTNMIRFQQAYNASARVLTTMNDMLTTLLTQVGGHGG